MTCMTPTRFPMPQFSRTKPRVAEEPCRKEAAPAPRHRIGFYSTLLPSRIVRNPLKTNDRGTLYSSLNQGVAIPCFLASLFHRLRITRHTMLSKFHSISLKTKESDPREVTQERDHLSFRTTDSLRTRSLPYRPLYAAPCYPNLVTRPSRSSFQASRRGNFMRALTLSFVAIVLAGIFAGTAAAQSTSSTGAGVSTVEQAIDQIVAREHDEIALIRRYTPIIETYVQDMKPDPALGIVPVKDHYFLGQAELSKGIADDSMLDKKKKGKVAEFNPFAHLEGSSSYVPEGFLQMVYLDPNGFDRQHYEFNYVGREFLGEVRCVVFDVSPLPKTGKGRFNGRIWAEDQGFAIVRFNGVFESSDGEGKGFNLHFDSWRMNLQPDLWLPAMIFSQESEIKNASDSPIRFRAQTRLWGYNLTNLSHPADFNQVPLDQSGLNPGKNSQDYSPIEAEKQWQERAEVNVVDRLQRIGLIAPPGEVDKVLETVVNNLEVTNNLDVDVHCRVMLTGTLESFSIGHTIVVSRGLIDVLPDEASLAAVLAQELAAVIITKPSTDQWGFNDTTNVSAGEALSRFSFKGTPAEVDM